MWVDHGNAATQPLNMYPVGDLKHVWHIVSVWYSKPACGASAAPASTTSRYRRLPNYCTYGDALMKSILLTPTKEYGVSRPACSVFSS